MISRSAGTRACAKAFALIALIAVAGCRRQPPEPLQLHLELAKTKIQVGEYPWYRFSVTNVGLKPIGLDTFLCWQNEYGPPLPGEEKTGWHDIEVIDASGKLIYRNDYRHPHYWTNDCGGDAGCSCKTLDRGTRGIVRYGPEKPLKGGRTFFATASVVAPIVPTPKGVMDGPFDPRDLPWSAYTLPPGKREALAESWKLTVERQGYLLGDPTFVSTMAAKDAPYIGYPKALYPGYRVFDDIGVDKPGRYRMRVIYRPFGTERTYEQVRKHWADSDAELERIYGWPKETRIFFYASNWVDFEVEAPPFPEHLFANKILRTKCDKLRNDWMRRSLRDAQVWQDDPFDKTLVKHSPKELPSECR